MRRYLIFYGKFHYPGGGWGDFGGSFDSAEEAKMRMLQKRKGHWPDWYHIIDGQTGMYVERIEDTEEAGLDMPDLV